MTAKVVDLEAFRYERMERAVAELVGSLGPMGTVRPLLYMYEGQIWHLDKNNQCQRGKPKPGVITQTLDDLEKMRPFLLGVALFDIGRAIVKQEIPFAALSVLVLVSGLKLRRYIEGKRMKT